jgi:hypothetical protein
MSGPGPFDAGTFDLVGGPGYNVVTRATFRQALRSRLGSTESGAPFWTDADLNTKIHAALRDWNLLTGYWSARVVIPTDSGQVFVSLPSTITQTTRLEWRGKPLHRDSLFGLDHGVPNWQSATPGTPSVWVPIALNLIALYPSPSIASNSLVADGIRATPMYSSDTAFIDLEESLAVTLLDYARHLCLFRLGGEAWEESKNAKKAFWRAAGEHNQRLKASALYREVLGLPADSSQQPFRRGKATVGPR